MRQLEKAAAAPQPTAGPRDLPTRASVLLVDDQPARLLTYEAILSGMDLECVRALSGAQALEQLLAREFAVILLDVEMPGMNGFEVAQLVREHPRLERTPIIFVTGVHVSEFDRLKGYEVGAIDYIAVPVVPEILRSKVALLVELYRRRSELQTLAGALQATRTRLEGEQADRDAQLQAVFDNPDCMTVVMQAERTGEAGGTDWVYLNANANALAALGLERNALVGRRLTEVLPADRQERVLRLCAQVLSTQQPVRYESQFAGKDLLITVFPGGPGIIVSCGTDITARKRAEAAVRENERRNQALMENAPVAIAHHAPDGRFEYVNRAFCELLGYSAMELHAKTWQEVTQPDDLAAEESLAQRVLAGEIAHYTHEKRFIRKDGSGVWVSLFGNFVVDDAGRAVQSVAIAIDITQRKAADQALRHSQERLLLAQRAARLGVHYWDVISGRIEWDERACELWGVKVGTPVTCEVCLEALHPDDRQSAQQSLAKALDPAGDGHYAALYRVLNRADGLTRWVEATGRAFFEGGRAVRLVATVQDVTDRKLADERLRASEERFRELANNIDQFAWTCNELGHATWYNDRWYEYTGTTFEDMGGDGWKKAHHPAHLERVAARLAQCMAAGEPWEDSFPLRGKDGQYRWFLSRAIPIRDAAGRVVRWFGSNTDITEERRLQDALKETDRRKDEFLAMLAHELRNPVAPISTAAEVLSRMLAGDDRSRPLVAMIKRQGLHLSRILDDLLDVARITQGRIELRREPIGVPACIELAVEAVQPLIRAKDHQLTVTRTATPLFVSADKVRLEQCVANLLSNAAKYTDPGGEIHVKSHAEAGNAVITVRDTGIGIPQEFQPRVFELFSQSERSLDRSQGGLGIGLSISKQLIEMHGGSITCSSDGQGRGATFTIRLPLLHEQPGVVPVGPSSDELRRRILVVDDNRDAADSLAMCLQLEGHEAVTAYSAESALAQVVELEPQVVLLDIGLPHMDGHECARHIKALGRSIRLIALSGYGQPDDKQRSLAAGFDAHITKPTDVATLQGLF